MVCRINSRDDRRPGPGALSQPVSARARLLMLAGVAASPALLSTPPSPRTRSAARASDFVIYYGSAAEAAIAGYRLAVLDSEASDLHRRDRTSVRLGYLSVGQVHAGRSYKSEVEREGLLFDADPDWPDARFVDLRAPRWSNRILDEIVPAMLAKGFRGVFLDTLDSAEALERRDARRYGGMVEAAAGIVRALRRRFPRRPIMINRGFALLPQVAGHFDMLLGESVSSTFDAASKRYRLVTPQDREWQVERMLDARKRNPQLRLFALDYWDPDDRAGIARLYAQERADGFTPYVATPDLTQVVSEP